MMLQNSIFYWTKEKSSDYRENDSVEYYVLSKRQTGIIGRPVYWSPVILVDQYTGRRYTCYQ